MGTQSHCAPEGRPLPASALDVPNISASSVTITPQTTGLCRGTVVLLHGLGQTRGAWSGGDATFTAFAQAMRDDGWQTCAIPYPADSGAQQTLLNTDYANDPYPLPVTRYLNRLLAEWDHVKALLIKTNGGRYLPTWCVGFSLGGWTTLQLLKGRPGDFVGGAALCPVTQMSYVYEGNTTPSFPSLFSSGATRDAAGDIGIHDFDGTRKQLFFGWGEGVEVARLIGVKTNGVAGTAGEAMNGSTDLLWVNPFDGGPAAVGLTTPLPYSTAFIPVASVPYDVGPNAVVTVGNTSGQYDLYVANGNQTRDQVAAAGGIAVVQQDATAWTNASSRLIQTHTGTSAGVTKIFVNSVPRDLVGGETLRLFHNSSRTQKVTVNGNQTQATVAANGYILVNSFTPNTDFVNPDYVEFYSYDAGADVVVEFGCPILVPGIGYLSPEVQVQDVNSGGGFNLYTQASGSLVGGNGTFTPAAATLRNAVKTDGSSRIYWYGDTFVGWQRIKLTAASASATVGAGGSVTTGGTMYHDHQWLASDSANIQAFVSAKLDPLYPRKY